MAPASLLGNWRAEIDKFAPSLKAVFLHPAETDRATLETIAANPAYAHGLESGGMKVDPSQDTDPLTSAD